MFRLPHHFLRRLPVHQRPLLLLLLLLRRRLLPARSRGRGVAVVVEESVGPALPGDDHKGQRASHLDEKNGNIK